MSILPYSTMYPFQYTFLSNCNDNDILFYHNAVYI